VVISAEGLVFFPTFATLKKTKPSQSPFVLKDCGSVDSLILLLLGLPIA